MIYYIYLHTDAGENITYGVVVVIIKGMNNLTCVSYFDFITLLEDFIRTKSSKYKLTQHHCHYDLKKYTYTNLIIPKWNSLSNYVVSAETVNTFE